MLKACLNTNWSDTFSTPPSERIETSSPVLPNGRFGTIIGSFTCVEGLALVCAKEFKGSSTDPKPAEPAVLMKALLEKFLFLLAMFNLSFYEVKIFG
jgi:hypothetical protein